MREMQARVRFSFVADNPLRRSCVSSARNALVEEVSYSTPQIDLYMGRRQVLDYW